MIDLASAPSEDYDSPWKDVLTRFFPEFMLFFFPHVYAEIDWSRGFEFLDKEMQRLSAKAAIGRRTVDKLARVWLKNGAELRVLIHVEVQGQREPQFPLRMFIYNYRLFDRYKTPIASFAILTDEDNTWRPTEYRAEMFGTELTLKFETVKLLDYRARQAQLEQSDNPFAIVVLAQLAATETHGDANARFWKKLEIAKHLYARGWEQERVIAMLEFLDALLKLPDAMDNEFSEKLDEYIDEYVEEKKMPYVTSMERVGIRKGIAIGKEEGKAEGKAEGSAEIVLRILKRRFHEIDKAAEAQIRGLSLPQIEVLSDALFDFASPDDLQVWLLNHPPAVSSNGTTNASLPVEE